MPKREMTPEEKAAWVEDMKKRRAAKRADKFTAAEEPLAERLAQVQDPKWIAAPGIPPAGRNLAKALKAYRKLLHQGLRRDVALARLAKRHKWSAEFRAEVEAELGVIA